MLLMRKFPALHRLFAAAATVTALVLGAHVIQAAEDRYTFTPLDYPGAEATFPQGINKGGTIVGFAFTPEGQIGWVYKHGVFTPIQRPRVRCWRG